MHNLLQIIENQYLVKKIIKVFIYCFLSLKAFENKSIIKGFACNHHTEQMVPKKAFSDRALFHYLYQNISHLICFKGHSSTLHPNIPFQILNMHLSINNHLSS